MDTLTKIQRSINMAAIKAKDTNPELRVRRELHSRGLRYKLHASKLPGKPDLIFPKEKIALFVHGCFWHGHKKCHRANMPKSNIEYWENKIKINNERDNANRKNLKKLGYKILVIWECQIKKEKYMEKLVRDILKYKKYFKIRESIIE